MSYFNKIKKNSPSFEAPKKVEPKKVCKKCPFHESYDRHCIDCNCKC